MSIEALLIKNLKMIKTLNKKQEALIPKFVDKWVKIGLSTEPTNRKLVEKWIPKYYEMGGLEPPKKIIFCSSPIVSGLACSIAYSILKNKKSSVRSKVESAVNSAVYSAVYSAVDSAVESAVESDVDSAVYSDVNSDVYSAVGSKVESAVRSAVRSAVYSAVESAVESVVESAVRSAVYLAVESAVLKENRFYLDRCGGNLWSGWQAYYDYMLMLGVKECKKLIPTFELSKQCGYIIPYKNYCFITEKPTKINMKNGKLHNETGKSIEWSDGWGLYSLDGITVPEWLIETPKDKLDLKKIIDLKNTEQRRVAMKYAGLHRFLHEKNKLDQFEDYELYLLKFEGQDHGPYLKMTCPSTGRIYLEGVGDPSEYDRVDQNIKTCKDALLFRAKVASNNLITEISEPKQWRFNT